MCNVGDSTTSSVSVSTNNKNVTARAKFVFYSFRNVGDFHAEIMAEMFLQPRINYGLLNGGGARNPTTKERTP